MALPPSVTVDKFVRVMTAAIMTSPEIAKLERNSVFTAMVRSAADGLIPDGKEAAIVGRGGKATYVPMVGGYRKIAAEYGWSLRGYAVHQADEFEHPDVLAVPVHRQARPGVDRGPLVAAWAVATHRDGRREVRVMYEPEILQRKALATTQNVWEKWPAEMWAKTAVRDLFAELPLDEGDRRVAGLRAHDIEPGEAARQLYGPSDSSAAGNSTRMTTPALPERAGGGESQQADGAATESTSPRTSDTASSAPGEHDDEPSLETEDERAAIQAAADQASMFKPPNGKHRDKTLSEILQVGDDGREWLGWALRKGPQLTPAAYRNAVWSFARVYATDLFEQVLAEQEAA